MKKNVYLLVLGLCLSLSGFSQHHYFQVGTNFPLQHSFRYDFRPLNAVSIFVEPGVLTQPYDRVIMEILRATGTDESTVELVENAFEFGYLGKTGINFHTNKWYFGAFYHYLLLTGSETPANAIKAYYDVNVNPLLIGPDWTGLKDDVFVESQLHQVGLNAGRIFRFGEGPFYLRMDLSLSKNIGSKTEMYSNNNDYSEESEEMDENMRETYKKYAYLPGVGLYLGYSF